MFERLERILDKKLIEQIKNLNVLIVGIGGVGGSALESLVRMGILNITIIDNDVFDLSNLNRQLLSNVNNIGSKKVLEANLRAKSINPSISINCLDIFLDEANFNEIEIDKFDYVLDCCDTINTKLLLIKECIQRKIKIISCMGTGNRFDPTQLEITNIWKTSYDPLAKKMRKLLKDNHILSKIPVVCSKEKPVRVSNPVGSTSLVPNVAGFYMTSFIINDIIDMKEG